MRAIKLYHIFFIVSNLCDNKLLNVNRYSLYCMIHYLFCIPNIIANFQYFIYIYVKSKYKKHNVILSILFLKDLNKNAYKNDVEIQIFFYCIVFYSLQR